MIMKKKAIMSTMIVNMVISGMMIIKEHNSHEYDDDMEIVTLSAGAQTKLGDQFG